VKKLNVVVTAYNRPKYLYITLDSIFRNKRIDEVDISVYIDGGGDRQEEVIRETSNFNISKLYINYKNIGILNSVMNSIRDSFYCGDYDEVFFLEDDHIIRKDTIDKILNTDFDGFFLSMSSCNGGKNVDYRPKGNVIKRSNFDILDEWIVGKKYTGLQRPNTDQALTEHPYNYDGVFYAFIKYNGFLSEFIDDYYVATFGIKGINSQNITEEEKVIHERFFYGDKSRWLDNVVSVLSEQPDEHNGVNIDLWPGGGFNYQ